MKHLPISLVVNVTSLSPGWTGLVSRSLPFSRNVALEADMATPGRARKALLAPGTSEPGGSAAVIG